MIKPAPDPNIPMGSPQWQQWLAELKADVDGLDALFKKGSNSARVELLSGSFYVYAGVWTRMAYSDTIYDPAHIYSGPAHFTPKVPGIYICSAAALSASGNQYVGIQKSGSWIGVNWSANYCNLVVSAYFNGTTDFMDVWTYVSTSDYMSLGSYCNFMAITGPV